MANFRRCLNFCDLHDIPFVGPPWTFDNKQKDNKNVKARIDRAVASHSWTALYPDAKLTHIVSSRSDHFPLLLECERDQRQQSVTHQKRYEHMWERDPALPLVIEEAWAGLPVCSNLTDLVQKVKETREHLHVWSTKNFGKVTKEISKKRNQLKKL
jgi:hypothetical protein